MMLIGAAVRGLCSMRAIIEKRRWLRLIVFI